LREDSWRGGRRVFITPFPEGAEGGGGLILLSFFRQAGFYPASIHPSFSSPRQGRLCHAFVPMKHLLPLLLLSFTASLLLAETPAGSYPRTIFSDDFSGTESANAGGITRAGVW